MTTSINTFSPPTRCLLPSWSSSHLCQKPRWRVQQSEASQQLPRALGQKLKTLRSVRHRCPGLQGFIHPCQPRPVTCHNRFTSRCPNQTSRNRGFQWHFQPGNFRQCCSYQRRVNFWQHRQFRLWHCLARKRSITTEKTTAKQLISHLLNKLNQTVRRSCQSYPSHGNWHLSKVSTLIQ